MNIDELATKYTRLRGAAVYTCHEAIRGALTEQAAHYEQLIQAAVDEVTEPLKQEIAAHRDNEESFADELQSVSSVPASDAAMRLISVNREVVGLKERIRQLEAQPVPVVGEPVAYCLSTDYAKLLQFLIAGNDAAGFVTTNDYMNGDVVGITRRGPYNIHIGVRGYSHASVYPFNAEDGTEEEVFIKACEFSRLKWIKPHHSIPAADIELIISGAENNADPAGLYEAIARVRSVIAGERK